MSLKQRFAERLIGNAQTLAEETIDSLADAVTDFARGFGRQVVKEFAPKGKRRDRAGNIDSSLTSRDTDSSVSSKGQPESHSPASDPPNSHPGNQKT